jgi:tellurite resistance protein TehA-like permease
MDKKSIEKFDPVSFAYVMASGSIAIALHVTGWANLAQLFLAFGSLGYIWFIFLFVLRQYRYPKIFMQEIVQVQEQFKYFTFSAGSSALAVGFGQRGNDSIGLVLGIVGIVSTVVITYAIFCLSFFKEKDSIQSVSPLWLLMAIASNSVGIVITLLWKHDLFVHQLFLVTAFVFWAFGVFIYFAFMTLNMYRMLFFPFEGKHFNPAYWTCMGAAAIAVVDGGNLVTVKNAPQFLEIVSPFIKGMILFLWGWGSAWIPILCFMGVIKHIYFKMPFQYHPSLWAIVFPLGMYTTATFYLVSTVQLDSVQEMIPFWLWIAVFSWFFVAAVRNVIPISNFKK